MRVLFLKWRFPALQEIIDDELPRKRQIQGMV
jgi:hypothetical protein